MNPGLGRSSGKENGNPLQFSCLGNPMDRGAWWATVHEVEKEWDLNRYVRAYTHVGSGVYSKTCNSSTYEHDLIWKESLCRGSQAEVRSLEAALIQYASLVAQVKASACNMGDPGLIPGLGRSPGEGKGYPLQYSGLENSMD